MSVCDTIVVLDFGKVIATGTPDQVRHDDAVTAAYLGVESAEYGEGDRV
jgi:branched-chain amino acid transport system ATP-binding protein